MRANLWVSGYTGKTAGSNPSWLVVFKDLEHADLELSPEDGLCFTLVPEIPVKPVSGIGEH